MTRHPQSGMTLVEVLVALAVFAVIGTASFALLDQTLRSQRLTETRLARLSDFQRMMRVVKLDTMQAIPGSLKFDKTDIRFLRRGSMLAQDAMGSEGLLVQYHLSDAGFLRQIGPEGSSPAQQLLLAGVKSVTWRPIPEPRKGSTDGTPAPVVGLDMIVQMNTSETIRGVYALPTGASPDVTP